MTIRAGKIFNRSIHLLIIIFSAISIAIYLSVRFSIAQHSICNNVSHTLSEFLKADVKIEEVEITPFNQIAFNGFLLKDRSGDTLLHAHRAMMGIELFSLLKGDIQISTIQLIGCRINIYRSNNGEPSNAQFIIDAFAPRQSDHRRRFIKDLHINNIGIRKGYLSYHVQNAPLIKDRFDVNHIVCQEINANLRNFEINDQSTLKLDLKKLRIEETFGIVLRQVEGHIQIDNYKTSLENLDIQLNNSRLQAKRLEVDNHLMQTLRQADNEFSCIQTQDLQLLISPEDFNLYFGQHNHIKQPIYIQMDIKGSNQKISIPNLEMTFTDNLNINAGLTLYKPYLILNSTYDLNPNENLWMVNIRSSQASPSAINLLLSGILSKKKCNKIAPIIERLGVLSFVGHCEGSYQTMQSLGEINTQNAGGIYIGSSIDHYTSLIPELLHHKSEGTVHYIGNIKTHQLHIGHILNLTDAGTLDANLDVRLSLPKDHSPQASIKGNINSFYWAGHNYKEVTLNTNLQRDKYNGEITLKDIDGEIGIKGIAHLTDTLRDIKFFADINHFHPHRLNLTKNKYMKDIGFSAKVESHIQFDKWDDINGTLKIEHIGMTSLLDSIRLNDIKLVSFSNIDSSDIRISSPIISLYYKGNEKISSMLSDAHDIVKQHFSGNEKNSSLKIKNRNNNTSLIVPNEIRVTQNDHQYDFSGTFFENRYISEFLGLPLSIHRDITFNGNINTAADHLYAEINIPHITYRDHHIQNLSGTIENRYDTYGSDSIPYLYFAGDGVCVKGNTIWEGHLLGECRHKKLISMMTFDHIAPRSSIKSVIDICSNIDTSYNYLLDSISITPRMLEINSHPWQSTPILIYRETPQLWAFSGAITHISPHSVHPNNSTRNNLKSDSIPSIIKSLSAKGHIDTQSLPKVEIEMQNFDLEDIFSFIDSKYLNFGGSTTGTLLIDMQDSIQHFSGHKLFIEEFSYQNSIIGNAFYDMQWNLKRNHMSLMCNVDEKSKIFGEIYLNPKGIKDSLYLTFDTEKLPVDFLSFWIGGVLNNFKAQSSGIIQLYGTTDRLHLEGTPTLQNVSFSNDFLGTSFSFDAPIYLSSMQPTAINQNRSGKIKLDNITLRDVSKETCTLTAEIDHRHLSDIRYRIDIDIPEKRNTGFLIYDHPYKPDNNTFWGSLYVHGACRLTGENNTHNINISAHVAGNSKFYLSPSENTLSEGSYNFLTFRNKTPHTLIQHTPRLEESKTLLPNTKNLPSQSRITADLILEMTPECRINVLMDPLADDRLTCQGYGNLNVKYNTHAPITLLGSYNMTSGKYTVTMPGDMMSKDFNIESGSSITFSGGTEDANLNIHATYSIPSVNLTDLDESFATLSSLSRTTVPVDCKLLVSGELQAPQIAFDVEVKRVSTDVQAMVRNIIGTSDMMSRQAFYLLLFGRFYTPDYATAASTHSGSEIASFASATLTSQLNHLLGQMSDYVSIGTHFRSDKGDFSDMEMDLALSTRLLNNRLLLNGNFGYRDRNNNIGANNTTNFIGDFDVEYFINPTGTFRLKAYSHYNERDYGINNAQTTQGVGFVFRREYENIQELLKRKVR